MLLFPYMGSFVIDMSQEGGGFILIEAAIVLMRKNNNKICRDSVYRHQRESKIQDLN